MKRGALSLKRKQNLIVENKKRRVGLAKLDKDMRSKLM